MSPHLASNRGQPLLGAAPERAPDDVVVAQDRSFRQLLRYRHRGAVALLALAGVCAIAIVFPAPFPGHVVSSNDLIRQVTPWATSGGPVDPIKPRNVLLADPAQVFDPDLYWARGQVRAGHLPLWNPDLFSGWPLVAAQQTAPFFPVKGLSYVMPYDASIGVEIVLLIALASLGTYLFARQLGLASAPSSVAGLAYGLSAPMLLWSLHPQSNVHATLPWMMLGAEGTLTRRRWGVPVLAAGIGVAALGGHPESVLLDGLLVAAWIVSRLARSGGWRARAARIVPVSGATLLGLTAGAIMLVPLAQLLAHGTVQQRGGVAGPGLRSLWTLAVPDVWGRPDWSFMFNPLGLENYVERTEYVGAAPALLAAIGLLVYRDAVRWFFAVAGLAAAVVALHVPAISPFLAARWPLRLVNVGREISVLAFCLALLGGLGLQAVLDRRDALRRPALVAVALALLGLPLAWIAARFHPHLEPRDAFRFLPGVSTPANGSQAAIAAAVRWALFAGGTLVLLALLHARRGRWPARALVLLVAVDLAIAWHGYVPVMDASQARLPLTPSIRLLRDNQGSGRSVAGASLAGGQPMVPNSGEYFGLRDARGRGIPTVDRTITAWTTLGGAGNQSFSAIDPSDPNARALRAFGVRDVLTFHGAPGPPRSKLLYSGIDGDDYLVQDTLPRAFVTCNWTPTSYAGAKGGLRTASDDQLLASPFVETASAPAPGCTAPSRAARIVVDKPTRVEIDVSGAGPGRLVLLDTYYPGWKATVDGHPEHIQAANLAFRSITLPPGAHRVQFRYQPAGVRYAVLVSAGAWILIAVLFLRLPAWVRRRRSTGTSAPD
jgi:Bacterial membrane protein YfhO